MQPVVHRIIDTDTPPVASDNQCVICSSRTSCPILVYECSAVRVSAYLCRSRLSKAVRLLLGCFTSEFQSDFSCYFRILGLHSLGVSCLAQTSFHSRAFIQLACCKYVPVQGQIVIILVKFTSFVRASSFLAISHYSVRLSQRCGPVRRNLGKLISLALMTPIRRPTKVSKSPLKLASLLPT